MATRLVIYQWYTLRFFHRLFFLYKGLQHGVVLPRQRHPCHRTHLTANRGDAPISARHASNLLQLARANMISFITARSTTAINAMRRHAAPMLTLAHNDAQFERRFILIQSSAQVSMSARTVYAAINDRSRTSGRKWLGIIGGLRYYCLNSHRSLSLSAQCTGRGERSRYRLSVLAYRALMRAVRRAVVCSVEREWLGASGSCRALGALWKVQFRMAKVAYYCNCTACRYSYVLAKLLVNVHCVT